MGPPPGLFAELSRWRDKATKRGKPCTFTSDIIPDWLSAEVVAAMDAVGVESAFSFLKATEATRSSAERRLQLEMQGVFDEFAPDALEAVEEQEQPDYAPLAQALGAILIPFFVTQYTEEALRVSADIGIEFDPGIINANALEWARGYSFDLVSGLTDTTRKVVSEAITGFIETPGMTQGDLEKLLEPAFGKVRAEMIATTETTRAYSAATNEIQKLINETGVQMERIWHTRGDELVCPVCGPLNEQPESMWIGDHPTGPPAHVNCILPGNVVAVPGLVAGAKSLYVGRAIEICTAGGRVLTVTENHPILTTQGWEAARLLGQGIDLIVCTAPEWIASSVYPDYQHMPAAIEKVFGAIEMSEAMASDRVPVSPKDLHGEGRSIYGNVHIVSPNGFLLGDIETKLVELASNSSLERDSTDEARFVGNGALALFGPRDDTTTSSLMSGSDLVAAALRGHTRPLDGLGLGLGTSRALGLFQDSRYNRSRDTGLARQFILRFASLIETDKISSVREFDFNGHVYDLQSGLYGLYIVNGVVSSNCRCASGLRIVTNA